MTKNERARFIAQVWEDQDGLSASLIDEGATLLIDHARLIEERSALGVCEVCADLPPIAVFTVDLKASPIIQMTVCAGCAGLWPDRAIVRVDRLS